MEKRTICRKKYKELRNGMTVKEMQQKSAQICDRVISAQWYQKAEVILGYYPLGNEVNILPVLEHALAEGKCVALPKTEPNGVMDFYEIKSLKKDVAEGAFHIMEPVINKENCNLLSNVDKKNAIVLTPGVVFDRQGNRYGYGRGFYDRYFERFKDYFRVGIAYDIQLSDVVLVSLITDIKMQKIVTEKEEIDL